MATVGAGNPTLADWAKRRDPNGQIAAIVEILSETNAILEDMSWVEGNLPTGHKTTTRSGLPTVAWRLLNYGVQPSKSRTVQVTDTCGMLEGYSEVDKSLADLNGNTAAFRLSEDRAFLESMNQEFASTLFYGNTAADPEKFLGLAPRFSKLAALHPTVDTTANVLDADYSNAAAGATQTSIWLVVWGPNTVHGIFPKGSSLGLTSTNLGEVTLDDAQSPAGHFQGYRTHYKWDCGLCVRDWRYVVRVCNIDVDLLDISNAPDPDLIRMMVQALATVQDMTLGVPVFYCNKTIEHYLRQQVRLQSNVNLGLDTVFGKKVVTCDGVPIRRCDAILNTEAEILKA